jgi:hypothetical protein
MDLQYIPYFTEDIYPYESRIFTTILKNLGKGALKLFTDEVDTYFKTGNQMNSQNIIDFISN